MGPWLASHGFVVIGIETNSRNDFDTARGTQLLAALDYLTQQSPVRDRVDPNRLAVAGHSMGGGGALSAAIRRPSLKAAVGIAPYSPSSNLANDRVPTMVFAGQADTVVTPSYATGLYNSLPATTESAYLEVAGADHWVHGRTVEPGAGPDHAAVRQDVRRQRRPVQPVPLPAAGQQRRGHLPQHLPVAAARRRPPRTATPHHRADPARPRPSPTAPPGAASQIVGTQSGRCVDVPNASHTNGTRVQL